MTYSPTHDERLVTGGGCYVGDIQRPGQLHAVVVRSPIAHGHLRGIDTTRSLAMPGVRYVLTAADLGLRTPVVPMRLSARTDLFPFLQPVLATNRVRYVGEPVAVVVADDQYLAEDAAESVLLDIEELPAALGDIDVKPHTLLYDGTDSNVLCRLSGHHGDIKSAFTSADFVVTERFTTGRHSGVPMETRGLIAEWTGQQLQVWGPTKAIYPNRALMGRLLGLDEEQIRFSAVDVGGAFGVRGEFYPEDFLIPWLARTLAAPVKWIEDRREHLMATNHSRQQDHVASIAVSRDGRFLAFRDTFSCDMGAYVRNVGVRVPELTIPSLIGPYQWPAFEAICSCILTNKTPTGTMRSPGRLEATFVRERLIDLAARKLEMDPIELRRLNLLNEGDMPFSLDLGDDVGRLVYDSGNYGAVLDRALETAGYANMRKSSAEAREHGDAVGVGVALFTEKTGVPGREGAVVKVRADGTVRVISAAVNIGQGIEMTLAAIASDALQIPCDRIQVICGDTEDAPESLGTFGSRSTIFAGSAVLNGCGNLICQGTELASPFFGSGAVRYGDGMFTADGEDSMRWQELMNRLRVPELSAEGVFQHSEPATAFGVHTAETVVDRDTGHIEVRRLTVGYDVGRAIDRRRVECQLVGGATHALGGTLFEEFQYDPTGQPQSTSFMDYLLPTCNETPRIEAHVFEVATAPANPLGVKGAGEGGVPGVAAAIASAVDDALQLCDQAVTALPITPDRVRSLILD